MKRAEAVSRHTVPEYGTAWAPPRSHPRWMGRGRVRGAAGCASALAAGPRTRPHQQRASLGAGSQVAPPRSSSGPEDSE
eukprot:14248523-Heterocapsa_arctica.AAC.1